MDPILKFNARFQSNITQSIVLWTLHLKKKKKENIKFC